MACAAREIPRETSVVKAFGVRDYNGGQAVTTRSGEGQATYHDLRERTKRQERDREENLKRLVELRRERQLHSFQSPDAALATDVPE